MCSSTHRLSAKGSRDASLMLRARARGVSAVVCVGAPLRARLTHEITHLDGRAVDLYIYSEVGTPCTYSSQAIKSSVRPWPFVLTPPVLGPSTSFGFSKT